MSKIIVLLQLVFCFKLSSQVFQIKNQLTDKPVPYATVIFSTDGVYTNELGYFEIPDSSVLSISSTDSIQIFCLGYQPLKTTFSDLNSTIYLQPRTVELQEVEIYAKEKKKKYIGYGEKVKHSSFFGSFPLNPKTELVSCLVPLINYKEASISKVYIHLAEAKFFKKDPKIKKGKIRINFYSISKNYPGKLLYSSTVKNYLFGEKRKTIVEQVDKLFSYNREGLCVGVESLGYFDESISHLKRNLNEKGWARILTPRKEIEDFQSTLYLKNLSKHNKFFSFDSIMGANHEKNSTKFTEKKPDSLHWNMAIGFEIIYP